MMPIPWFEAGYAPGAPQTTEPREPWRPPPTAPAAPPWAPAPGQTHFFRSLSGGGTMFHTVAVVPAGWRLRLRRISGTLHHLGGPRQLLLGINARPSETGPGALIVERQLLSFSEPDGPEQFLLPLTPLDLPVRAGERVFVSVQGAQNALSVFIAGEWEPEHRAAGADR